MAATAPHILFPKIVSRVTLRKVRHTADVCNCCIVTKRFFNNGSFSQEPQRPGPKLWQTKLRLRDPALGRRLMSDIVPDLQRFLLEVGTDPREARYWLKQFTKVSSEPARPFALVFVEDEVFSNKTQLDALASSISFLQRNHMKTVILVGNVKKAQPQHDDTAVRRRAVANMVELTKKLECNGTGARLLFPGSGVVEMQPKDGLFAATLAVSPALLHCSLLVNSVPILSCFGETDISQMVAADEDSLILELARVVRPLKVIHINSHGGFTDDKNQRIANVHLPADLTAPATQSWCVGPIRQKMETMYTLLKHMPPESSAVITSSDKMLAELFSHRGSGTFFTIIEKIHTFDRLEGVDETKLVKLFDSSFQKSLRLGYLNEIRDQILKIFVSERYNAAAIVLKDKKTAIPYMCKFAVSPKAQGAGTGENLWQMVRTEFKQLFWRSQHQNPINPWYFKQSEGSWSDKKWTVFWYGIEQPSLSPCLVESALARQPTFLPPGVTRETETSMETSLDSPK